MSQTDPIIVIGAGHNGLTTGAYLAKSGHKVLIYESRNIVGGIAATEPIFPGYRFNTGFANTATYLQQAVRELALESYGFKQRRANTAFYAALPGREGFALDGRGKLASGKRSNPGDVEKLEAFVDFVLRNAGVFAAMLPLTPPDIKSGFSFKDLWPWMRVALKVRGLGKREMMDFLRVLPMSARELLDEWFSDEDIRGAFALFSVIGAHLGPLGSGTAANMLYNFTGGFAPSFAVGGAGSLSEALERAIEANGGEIYKESTITEILLDNGRVAGIRTAGGETVPAKRVVSSVDPIQTFFRLVGSRHLPVKFSRRLQNVRMRGTSATVHFAMKDLPDFGVDQSYLDGWITFSPGLMHVERAYDDAKYGRVSRNPALLAAIPSLFDRSMAPDGHHAMSVLVRYAPCNLREEDYSGLLESVIATIEASAPGFRKVIVESKLITPDDYAQEYGLTDGAWMHGQMGLDQLIFMRPVAGWARYTTPVEGLFLCGSGTHPGGGITGAPGFNAARELMNSR